MKSIKTITLIIIAFISGYGLKSMIAATQMPVGRVTSIGGIFFKSKNPKELRTWYHEKLGITVNEYGAVFEWRKSNTKKMKGFTQWSPFKSSTHYFQPSEKDFMINYRVDNLDILLQRLESQNVIILDSISIYDYGKFVHIMDIDSNKIELWEPNDIAYEDLGKSMQYRTNK